MTTVKGLMRRSKMYHVTILVIDEQRGLGRCSPSPIKDKTPALTCQRCGQHAQRFFSRSVWFRVNLSF